MTAAEILEPTDTVLLDGLVDLTAESSAAAGRLTATAKRNVTNLIEKEGHVRSDALEREQHNLHGLAWLATYAESLHQMTAYAERMEQEGRLGELEALITQAAFASYLAQIAGGIAMGQGEIIYPHELGLTDDDLKAFRSGAVKTLISRGGDADVRQFHRTLAVAGHGANRYHSPRVILAGRPRTARA